MRTKRILVLLVLILAGCASKDWDMVSRRDIPSPDGKRIAVVFEMCSYNTTGYWPQVSVLQPGQKLGKHGNVLQGGPGDSFTARWISTSNLVVQYHCAESRISYPPASTNTNGILIEFRKQ